MDNQERFHVQLPESSPNLNISHVHTLPLAWMGSWQRCGPREHKMRTEKTGASGLNLEHALVHCPRMLQHVGSAFLEATNPFLASMALHAAAPASRVAHTRPSLSTHTTSPDLRMISGHPIAMNANTQAKLILTLRTCLNFFRSKCQINLKER
jgi:hypothetical protein